MAISPEFLPQYLPDIAFRQLLAEVDVLGDFVTRQGFAAVLDDVLLGDVGVLGDDVESDYFAGVLVGLRDGGAFQDAGVRGRDSFDFVGVDVEA